MKLLDVIFGRNDDANWKRVPYYPPDEALLILTKSLLSESEALTESVAGYTEGSQYCQGQQYFASVVTSALGGALDELTVLTNTPIGDRTTLDAFTLARTQLEAVTDKKGANK